MSFIDTVYGRRICDLAIMALRKFTKRKEQYCIEVNRLYLEETINKELKGGSRYVGHIISGSEDAVIILEKDD